VSLEDLRANDFIPFKKFFALELSGVMLSHFVYPSLSLDPVPATYSRDIIQNILIDELKFSGLIMTDDLLMLKPSTQGSSERTFGAIGMKAFQAGADQLLLSWCRDCQSQVFKTIFDQAAKDPKLAMAVIARAEKIENAKIHLESLQSAPNSKLSYPKLVQEIIRRNLPAKLPVGFKNTLSRPCVYQKQIQFWESSGLAQVAGHSYDSCKELSFLFSVKNRMDVEELKTLPETLLKRTIVINQYKPMRWAYPVAQEISLFITNGLATSALASMINESLQAPDRREALLSASASGPTRDRPETLSEVQLREPSALHVPTRIELPQVKSQSQQELKLPSAQLDNNPN
jgi:hypothetical protein